MCGLFERDRLLRQSELQRAISMIANSGTRERTRRCHPVAATVGDAERHRQQHRRSQRPPAMESDPATSGAPMGRVLQPGPQLRDELRAWAEFGCAVKSPLHALPQRATACELGATYRTRLQVTQNLVIRFGEELLAEERIRHFTNVAAFHGWSQISAR